MNNDHQRGHRIAMTIFAAVLTIVMMAAFITTIEGVDTRQANVVAQPGTTGMEPIRN